MSKTTVESNTERQGRLLAWIEERRRASVPEICEQFSVSLATARRDLETLAEHGVKTQDPAELTREVRVTLAQSIVQQIYGPVREMNVIAFEPGLEALLVQSLAPGSNASLEPGVAEFVMNAAADAASGQEEAGVAACLLVPDRVRVPVARLIRKSAPRLRVIGHAEVPESLSIRIGRIIGELK